MKACVLDEQLLYDGTQLCTAFVDAHGGDGQDDVIILWTGPADVPAAHMVDLDDAEAGRGIASASMVHVIVEHRGVDLPEGVWRQRLLMRLMAGWIAARSGTHVDVRGDDLWVGDGKLSVSIATRSPRSCLIHAALNIETRGTPVKTAGLRDLRIRPLDLQRAVVKLYGEEVAAVNHAVNKVRPVA